VLGRPLDRKKNYSLSWGEAETTKKKREEPLKRRQKKKGKKKAVHN
jgi:hypothetical protein